MHVFLFLYLALFAFVQADPSISYFLHITDLHMDINYRKGSPNQCVLGSTGLGCCRPYDIPLNGSQPAGSWGDKNCDAPQKLIEYLLDYIGDHNASNLDFVLYGGDTVGHHDLSQSYGKNLDDMHTLHQALYQRLPAIPVFPNRGNHDTFPIDQTVPFMDARMRDDIAKDWEGWIGPEAAHSFQKNGYYNVSVSGRLTVASIDTISYDTNNLAKQSTVGRQAQWLEGLLEDTQRRPGHKVLLLGHIFPKAGESPLFYDEWMAALMSKYQGVLMAKLFGHSHEDAFRIYESTLSTIFPTVLITPSLMPDHRDPCYRLYAYNTKTLILRDYEQYCVDLDASNAQDRLVVYLDYRFSEAYVNPDFTYNLTDDGLYSLARALGQYDSLAQTYCNYNTGKPMCRSDEVNQKLAQMIQVV